MPVASALPWTHGEPTYQTRNEPRPQPPAKSSRPQARLLDRRPDPGHPGDRGRDQRDRGQGHPASAAGSIRKSPAAQGPSTWVSFSSRIRLPISVVLVSGPWFGENRLPEAKMVGKTDDDDARDDHTGPRQVGHDQLAVDALRLPRLPEQLRRHQQDHTEGDGRDPRRAAGPHDTDQGGTARRSRTGSSSGSTASHRGRSARWRWRRGRPRSARSRLP